MEKEDLLKELWEHHNWLRQIDYSKPDIYEVKTKEHPFRRFVVNQYRINKFR